MVQEVVQHLRRALADRPAVRFALLFGSVARGTDRPDSDVDVAIDAPGVDLLALARDLSLALDREVSMVDLTDPGYPLLAALVRDGVVVVEHVRGAGARWRTRAILSLETDRPWYERMRDAYLARLAREAQPGG